jgi:hypothetical protein
MSPGLEGVITNKKARTTQPLLCWQAGVDLEIHTPERTKTIKVSNAAVKIMFGLCGQSGVYPT